MHAAPDQIITTNPEILFVSSSMTSLQAPNVKHTAPINLETFFIGSTNLLFASGGHAITM
jgi:auxin influx carrier (AUX1 LAX family)